MNTLSDRDLLFNSQPLKAHDFTYRTVPSYLANLNQIPLTLSLLSRNNSLSYSPNQAAFPLQLALFQNLIDSRMKGSQSGLCALKFVNEPIISFAKNLISSSDNQSSLAQVKPDMTPRMGFKRYNRPIMDGHSAESLISPTNVSSKTLSLESHSSVAESLGVQNLAQNSQSNVPEQSSLEHNDSRSDGSTPTTTSSKSENKTQKNKPVKENPNPQAKRLKKLKEIKVRKDEQKKKEKYFQTKSEIISLISKEIQESLGLSDLCQEKIYNLLSKNEMDPTKAMMRVKVNPIYYKKYFQG